MAKFKPMELIDKMSGKFSSKSKYYAAEKYGTQFTGKVGEITVPPTAAQTASRAKFATCVANTRTRMMDPMQLPIDQAAYAAVKNQYPSFYAYVFNQEWALL